MSGETSLLTVDVGNTHTIVGLFHGDRIVKRFRFTSRHFLTPDECFLLVNLALTESGYNPPFNGSAICSVVPQLTGVYESVFEKLTDGAPVIVSGAIETGVTIRVERPEQVGADRIANAAAAHRIHGGDVIVVDLGTATTFDIVSREGEYLGGVIAAGIFTSAQRLFEKAAMIPRMDISIPTRVIGKTTVEATKSGIYFGAVAQIEGLVARIKEEWGRDATVIATGGYANLIAKNTSIISLVDPDLTLRGIYTIWRMQQNPLAK